MNKYYTCFLNNNFYYEGIQGCDNMLPDVISNNKEAYVLAVRRSGKLHDVLTDYVINEGMYSTYGLSCYLSLEVSDKVYYDQMNQMSKEDKDNYMLKICNIMTRNNKKSIIKSKGAK